MTIEFPDLGKFFSEHQFLLVLIILIIAVLIAWFLYLHRNKDVQMPWNFKFTQPAARPTLTEPVKEALPQPHPAVALVEKSLVDTLAKHVDREGLLLRELSITRVARFAEQMWSSLHPSQIHALRLLRVRGGSVSRNDAVAFFEQERPTFPATADKLTFEQWASFPVQEGLAELRPDTVRLTDVGDAFVTYVEGNKQLPALPEA